MVFDRIIHNRTADAIVDQIEELILQGVLRTGDRLPSERDLAKQLDVSRPILREALKTLETRGLIVARHGGGTFVADVIGTVFSEPIVKLFARQPAAVFDYLEFRREIEQITSAFAAERATAADREILTRLIEGMKEAHERGAFDDEAELDVEFHHAIGESAHNILLLHTLRSCYRLLADGVFYSRVRLYQSPEARDRLLEQHVAIHEAIMSGDPEAARRAAASHVGYVADSLRQIERVGAWEEVSERRLSRFSPGAGGTRKRAAPSQQTYPETQDPLPADPADGHTR
ncbi:FadR/GntR family transcriptional regulator [Amorphus orientalis]|uniref:Pyruvate dehydrogenase complex repressor n=1 Tax=Amorphus orientalis TaxID=649198 RepID=A0AAE3VQX3_9HYPH|nr:FadR/GntR family transcriptional regulator [Amorphus orientalis]MDQ0316523.1 GntR family transcriptional repressor for pyruvate dehydrogenase complex [Amorphus orientalis]